MEQITITEDNLEILTLEYKQKVPREVKTELDCIKFIMHFKIIHKDKFIDYDDVKCYDILSDMSLKALQLTCSTIRYYVNDGSYLASVDYLKEQFNTN